MTVDVQALFATISLAVIQAVQQALGQGNKAPTPVNTEVVEALVQDEVSVITEGRAVQENLTWGGQIANASSHPPSARELVPTLKGFVKFRTVVGHTQTQPASLASSQACKSIFFTGGHLHKAVGVGGCG